MSTITNGLQYDKQHATTVVATAPIAPNRLVGYDGAHATQAGGLHDALGVSESGAQPGEAVSCITGFSALVEASEAIAFGDDVTVAADGSGRAAKGESANRRGRALGTAGAAGELLEVQLL